MKETILRLVDLFQAYPYPLVFFGLLGCGLGVPLPEEFFLVMSGYVCYRNGVPDVAGLIPMFIVTWVAIGGGDLLAFAAGRRWGNKVFEIGFIKRLISAEGLAKAEAFLQKYGSKTVMAARFLPGIRMPTYVLCGTLNMPVSVFMLYDGLAMLVSVPTQVYITWRYGSVLEDALKKVAVLNRTFLILAVITALIVYYRIHSGKSALPGLAKSSPAGEPGDKSPANDKSPPTP
jgi:membrane protein DedA with SNARE-associated domain